MWHTNMMHEERILPHMWMDGGGVICLSWNLSLQFYVWLSNLWIVLPPQDGGVDERLESYTECVKDLRNAQENRRTLSLELIAPIKFTKKVSWCETQIGLATLVSVKKRKGVRSDSTLGSERQGISVFSAYFHFVRRIGESLLCNRCRRGRLYRRAW